MYISMKTYSKKLLVAFFFSDVANGIDVLFDGSGESFFLNFREFGEVTDR